MQTPPPPMFSCQTKISERTAKTPFASLIEKAPDRTAKTPFASLIGRAPERTAKTPFGTSLETGPEKTNKTPFQNHQSYQRHFESEFQPNKASSRFQLGTRFCNTGQRPVTTNPQSQKSLLVSRLQKNLRPQNTHAPKPETNVDSKPNPLPPNRSTHQISRTQSEPSIRQYHVRVNDKTYKILRKIGSGGSAKVYEGFESQTLQTVAIKIINIAQADSRTRESYFNEKSILKRLRDNRHVVRMFDSEYKAEVQELVIVMEKGDADLSLVIDSYFKNKSACIDGLFIKYYWRGMVQAVHSIHKHGIVHADLKPVNFILVKNEIKLIDFGIASAVDPGGTSIIKDYQIGTINYMAPESLRNRALDASIQQRLKDEVDENDQQKKTVIKYNSKADIWSLGCILYNLVYGVPPFEEYKDVPSKVQAITNPRHVINFPKISNLNLLNCMRSCLRYNPADRPTAQDLLNDPYLREDIVMLQNA